MKKAAFLVALVAIFAVVSVALAGQYARPKAYTEPADTGMTAYAEKTTSMTDCMTFSASHKSRGEAADKVEFNRQFGEPLSAAGAATEYSYDKYTKIILDCSKRQCFCRCLAK